MTIENINFYGVRLSRIIKSELYAELISTVENKKKKIIFGYSLGSFRIFKRFPIMVKFGWENADIMMVDGRGLFLLGKLLGFSLGDDISIPELSHQLLEIAESHTYSIMLLGTKREINNQATRKLRIKYPNITVCDGIDGYFQEKDEERILNRINECKPDILYVGISSPKKEEFVARMQDRIDARIILLCGGVIDIFAGDKKQTPRWLKKIGGAGLYRFIQEPGRLYKYFFPFIFFFLFNFVPVLIFHFITGRLKSFSIPEFYKINF